MLPNGPGNHADKAAPVWPRPGAFTRDARAWPWNLEQATVSAGAPHRERDGPAGEQPAFQPMLWDPPGPIV